MGGSRIESNLEYLLEKQESDGRESKDNQSLDSIAKKIVGARLEKFEASLSQAQVDDEVISAIASLLRSIEIFHLFPDGNQRTIAFLLLDKLLVQNNLPPAILDHPEVFDGYKSIQQLVQEIKKGIYNFLKLTGAL